MKIAIIAALDREINYYIKTISHLKQYQIANVIFWEGIYEDVEIIISQCGVGKVNAAIATTIVAQHHPDLLINTGSAGAVTPQLKVGDVVVATGSCYHDVDLTAFGNPLGQMDSLPLVFPCDKKAAEKLKQVIEMKTKNKVVEGLVLSGDRFIADTKRVEWLSETFRDAQCVEMEGAAIGQVAYQFGLPYVIVRAISDTASHDADISFQEFIVQVGEASARMTLHAITELAKSVDFSS